MQTPKIKFALEDRERSNETNTSVEPLVAVKQSDKEDLYR
jgi:hypothetical protein